MKILLDTSVLIDFTRAKRGLLPKVLERMRGDKASVYVPTIVIAELWAGKSMEDKLDEELTERMIQGFLKVSLTADIAKLTGGLLRTGQIQGATDAIIAATALNTNAKLATGNKKHFMQTKGLRFF